MNNFTQLDRYQSFCGLECDQRAQALMDKLRQQVSVLSDASQWRQYFQLKFDEQQRMQHDDLFFVGAQMNVLNTYFNEVQDKTCLELLWHLEQDCC